ncbi:glyceraldehyde-3-phosphate dehydrogenase [Candidatus Caldarchaeum subterraneum]|uniref:Glyceraldehyde-3-phosphate dehydrogenase n=1 Tax=Caldiarchaeum subterraneum TaxID=311458 RepID=E6N8D2_CALS0|nr:glyceraldehyde-3-phosphate dehydrogenase [Candidatus Caldarchaeum subterraneum]BAJ48603.1 glyceraldehyde-3-phosphate dehydrogenase [Candidatus Caldarchaeum subterraneum]BAJ51311.1 glyceraldehyde-3-phosphate dehydrogenase [Candidatus Caldarchaeum subterraneum]
MIRVGINGYGTIGRRVADAVMKQNDMKLVGVVKNTPDYKARLAVEKNIPLYCVDESGVSKFRRAGFDVSGVLDDLLKEVDVIVDCTPGDVGKTYREKYFGAGVRAVFQGGEEADVAETSFVAQCNYERAVGRNSVRVVSCNTTGLCRVLNAFDSAFGLERARVVIARRAVDPEETSKGVIDAVVLDPVEIPSHHAEDVNTVLPHIDIVTMALKVPTTHMHLHSLILSLRQKPTRENVLKTLAETTRVKLFWKSEGFKGTANLYEYGRELGRPRGDIYEACVIGDSVTVKDNEVFLYLGVHQEAIVVPENIDAIRALMGEAAAEQSIKATNQSLGIV